jgi:hypothetical protein
VHVPPPSPTLSYRGLRDTLSGSADSSPAGSPFGSPVPEARSLDLGKADADADADADGGADAERGRRESV